MGQAPAVCNPFTASADLVLTRFIRPPFQRPDMSWWPEREHPELFKGAAPLSLSPSKEHSKHAEVKGGGEESEALLREGVAFGGLFPLPPPARRKRHVNYQKRRRGRVRNIPGSCHSNTNARGRPYSAVSYQYRLQ